MNGTNKPAEKSESKNKNTSKASSTNKKSTDKPSKEKKTEKTAKSGDKSNSGSTKNNSTAGNVKSILINDLHYKQTAENVFEKEMKSGNKYKLELHASITESFNNSNFNKFANLIIEEQTKTMEATFTIENDKRKKTKSYQIQIPFEIDSKGLHDLLIKRSKQFNLPDKDEKQQAENSSEQSNTPKNKIEMFKQILDKLNDYEIDAFATFFGDKFAKALISLGKN